MRKKILVTVDEESQAILARHKAWGKSASFLVNLALKKYEEARSRVAVQKAPPAANIEFEEKAVEYD